MALSSEQTSQLRRLIEERRRALAADVRTDVGEARAERFGQVAGEVPDTGDESVATLIADLDQAELSRDLDELRGLDAATARLDDGSYGICADCGSDIGFERLRAQPAALRCIRCQEMHEKTF